MKLHMFIKYARQHDGMEFLARRSDICCLLSIVWRVLRIICTHSEHWLLNFYRDHSEVNSGRSRAKFIRFLA